MKGRIFHFFVFLLLWPTISHAQPITLTFLEALKRAQTQNINVVVAREKVRLALSQMHEAKANLLPQIEGAASETRQTRNLEAQGINFPGMNRLVGPFNTFDARVYVTQNLVDAASVALFDYAQNGKKLALEQEKQAKAEAVALVASLYLNAERATQRVRMAEAYLKRDAEAYKMASHQAIVGSASSFNRTQQKALLDESQQELIQIKSTAAQSSIDLAVALNFKPDTLFIFPAHQPEAPFKIPHDEDIKKSVQQNPAVVAKEKEMKLAKSNQKVALSSFLPTVKGHADYGLSGTTPSNTEKTYTYGANLSVPLFQGGLKMARYQQAKSEFRTEEALFKNETQKIEAASLKAKSDWMASQSLVIASQSNMKQAQAAYDLAQEKQKTGLGTSFEVTRTYADLALARDHWEEAVVTERLAKLNLIYNMGQIENMLAVLETMP